MLAAVDWSIEKVLASLPTDPDELLASKCPDYLEQRLDELLELNRANRLDDEMRDELERFMQLDSRIWKLKAKALEKKARGK